MHLAIALMCSASCGSKKVDFTHTLADYAIGTGAITWSPWYKWSASRHFRKDITSSTRNYYRQKKARKTQFFSIRYIVIVKQAYYKYSH